MKNTKTTMLSVRILEEEKEKLQDEANARGILLSEVVKEMIAERVNGSSYDKNLMAGKKDIELPKKRCPYCAIVVDWAFVKIRKISSGEEGKYCPNPDCRKLVYTYSEEKGWQERESETEKPGLENKEAKEFDDLIEATARFEIEEKNKQESEKRESEKRESEKRESKKKKKKKEKVYGGGFFNIITYDDEEKKEEE